MTPPERPASRATRTSSSTARLEIAVRADAPSAAAIEAIARRFPQRLAERVAVVSLGAQTLHLIEAGIVVKTYPVSTSRLGAGQGDGSFQTPLGGHRVGRKIGGDAASGTIFKGRRDTGRVAEVSTACEPTGQDTITSRILWLEGLEPGVNQGAGVDSFERYIYIHGTHEEGLLGQPASHGCVRMANADVIELYERVPQGALVLIVE